ncbi:unnamed protein product [Urochloa humidicola]
MALWWSPPAPVPFPNWVILERAAQVPPYTRDPEDPALVLREPPHVSNLVWPINLHPKPFCDSADPAPYIIAANNAGLLHVSWRPLLGFNLNRYPAGVLEVASDFIQANGNGWATGTAERVPPNTISNIRNVALVSIPGTERREYAIAELRIPAAADADDDGPTLHTFRSGANAWSRSEVSCNAWDWSGWELLVHDVVAHGGNLWWVNLEDGLIGGDPLTVDENGDADLRYVALPFELDLSSDDMAPPPENIKHIRMVTVSHRKLRCVGIAHRRDQPAQAIEVGVWTLVQRPALSWRPRCLTSFGKIWAHESYNEKAELTEEIPVLALLHPTNPDIVYFFLDNWLFGVDVSLSEVVDFLPVQHGLREVAAPFSWRHVLAWMLPNSLEHALDYEYMDNDHYPTDCDEEVEFSGDEMEVSDNDDMVQDEMLFMATEDSDSEDSEDL